MSTDGIPDVKMSADEILNVKMSTDGIPNVKMSTDGIPDVKMSRTARLFGVTPSGFPKRTCGVLPYPDSLKEKISYPDMLSGSLT